MSLSIALKPNLPNGAYDVEWNNTAADDGDTLAEGFTFYVGSAPAESPTSAPVATATPHTHTPASTPAAGATSEEFVPATTGLLSAAVTSLNTSGVTGRVDVFPVDGGTKTRVDVILSGLAPDSMHAGHIHEASTCFEGPHVADLNTIMANAAGVGSSSTIVDEAFSHIASGEHNVLYHAADGANPGVPIACGLIPAQPAPAVDAHDHGSTGTIALPNTGDGSVSGRAASLLAAGVMLAVAGAIAGGAGVAMRPRRG